MDISPIQLSEEQKALRDQQRIEAFTADYIELTKKHNIHFQAALSTTARGIIPVLVHAERVDTSTTTQENA